MVNKLLVEKISEINDEELFNYKVAEDIDEILDGLSFRGFLSQLSDWKLFTKRNGNNEFAAIYKNREYLVYGPYSRIEVPQRDLESITKYIFNENGISKILRNNLSENMVCISSGILCLTTGACALIRLSDKISDPLGWGLVAITAGIGVVGAGSLPIIKSLINKQYASRLSEEAVNYNYGQTAEELLRKSLLYEKIKSGKLEKKKFLELSISPLQT